MDREQPRSGIGSEEHLELPHSASTGSLCDQRLAPNIQIDGHPFRTDDVTMTALVSLATSTPTGAKVAGPDSLRHSHLPDDAAGIFAPGWDVARDWIKLPSGQIVWHLASYGLGSPFPEDAKLWRGVEHLLACRRSGRDS